MLRLSENRIMPSFLIFDLFCKHGELILINFNEDEF